MTGMEPSRALVPQGTALPAVSRLAERTLSDRGGLSWLAGPTAAALAPRSVDWAARNETAGFPAPTRSAPGLVVLVVDQSSGMSERAVWADSESSLADMVSLVANRALMNVVLQCAREEEVSDYMHVAVVGHGGGVRSAIGDPGWLGPHPISELARHPLRVDHRSGVGDAGPIRVPVWLDGLASGRRDLAGALREAERIVESWIGDVGLQGGVSVLCLCGGIEGSGDPRLASARIRSLSSEEREVIVSTHHLVAAADAPLRWPSRLDQVADQAGMVLLQMASAFPPSYIRVIRSWFGPDVEDGARAYGRLLEPLPVVVLAGDLSD